MIKLDWGEGRVQFFTIKAEIEAALRTGRPKRAVWEQFHDQLGIGYAGFVRLTVRYIGPVLPTVSLSPKAALRPQTAAVVRGDETRQQVESSQPIQQKTAGSCSTTHRALITSANASAAPNRRRAKPLPLADAVAADPHHPPLAPLP